MLQHIQQLKSIIDAHMDDPRYSKIFGDEPALKYKMIYNLLGDLVFKIDFLGDPATGPLEIERRRDKILETINSRYQYIIGQPYKAYLTQKEMCSYIPWRLHDTHFHPAFDDYVKCPFTCLAELSEMVERICSGMEVQ
jgi:hypothetical protein